MADRICVRKDSYHDSVLLMRISRELKQLAGVTDAVVAMGTPHNRELLAAQGFDVEALQQAGPNDLVIAVKGETGAVERIDEAVDALLAARRQAGPAEHHPATLTAALQAHPEANLVLISVPGVHAAREARRALRLGRHVMIFSDNVSVEEEVALKQEARARGLLMMGPDCGTAILAGKPLAFANVVRKGAIGLVAAAGTGLQEVSCCVHRLGGGISQAIGTGGRDLSDAVGGIMTLTGVEALAADPTTSVIVVISKPPSPAVARKVVAALAGTPKPAVVHFVGDAPREAEANGNVRFADSLAGAAELACGLAGIETRAGFTAVDDGLAARLAGRLRSGAQLRGLFCGGTTGAEALALLGRAGFTVRSNLHKQGPLRVDGSVRVDGHVLLDLGDDLFTQGRPHPMIEPLLRNERLELEMEDERVGVLLFDVVLGYGSHPDPAGVLASAASGIRTRFDATGLVAIASVTGTQEDPQGLERQQRALESAGIIVMPDNRRAAELAAAVLERVG